MMIITQALKRTRLQLADTVANHTRSALSLILSGIFTASAHAGWERQWMDSFDGTGVDFQNNWTAQTQADYNNEVQCYTDDDSSPDQNYDVSDGTLKIIARKQTVSCSGLGGQTRTWTSGRLNSKDKQEFLYGRIESRIRFSTLEGGTWPAFWMLEGRINEQPVKGDGDNIPWNGPGAGEIDVWEWFSNDPNSYITNFFNTSGCGGLAYHNYPGGPSDVLDWHTYAIEWSEDVISFFRDDTQVATYNVTNCAQYKEPMFVLLNVAIGGNLGGEISEFLTTATMEVDYVAHCTATSANSETNCNEQTPEAQGGNGGGNGGGGNGSVVNGSSLALIDHFESALPAGSDVFGNPIGFATFQGGNSTVNIALASPPSPVPETGNPNSVLQVDVDSATFAGFIHKFENGAVDTWVAQDWSSFESIRFWFYGSNSGTELFIDVLDNRNPGSDSDDAERFTVAFVDDFSGWQQMEFPFADFTRKDIGNGAPDDGLNLDQVNGWAFGTLDTFGPRTFYLDNFEAFGRGRTTNDFSNDAKADILLRSAGGSQLVWTMDGSMRTSTEVIGGLSTDWTAVAIDDFDSDGDADILYRDLVTGRNQVWTMDGTTRSSADLIGFASTSYTVSGTGDFNADGKPDILLRSSGGSQLVWTMDGAMRTSTVVIGGLSADWTTVAVDDFDGDGDADILYRDLVTGRNLIWTMDGLVRESADLVGFAATSYTVAGTGDFNKDGKADILFRSSGGSQLVWTMNGATRTASVLIGGLNTSWVVVAVDDYDGDRDADILYRDLTSGRNLIWTMDGLVRQSANLIGFAAATYVVQPE